MSPMKKNQLLLTLGIATTLLSSAPLKAAAENQSQEVTTRLEKLFEASKKVNVAGPEKQKARETIEKAMDWEKIAQMCLGAKLAKKNAGKNFDEFKGLLKEVVTRTAFTRLDKFWEGNTNYKFENIDVKSGTAKVPAKFFVKGEPFELEYYFIKKGNEWLIYDISYEEIRYSTNISEQIDAFLKDGNFSTLLSKLKKRRDTLIEEEAQPKKS